MPEPIDIKLYKKVKKMADEKFLSKTGAYKSSWIVRKYKKLGGKYKGKQSLKKGLKRWYKEKWVDLNRPIKKSGKIIGYKECGRKSSSSSGKYPTCRPSKRISKKTPKTYKELSKKIISIAKKRKSKVKHHSNISFKQIGKGGGDGIFDIMNKIRKLKLNEK